MAWQKCPVCNGLGRAPEHFCPVCKGALIISEVTGKPPAPDLASVSHVTIPNELDAIKFANTPGRIEDLKPEEIIKPLSTFEELSDDEILYYSTPYYDELQAKKELQAAQIKEDESK